MEGRGGLRRARGRPHPELDGGAHSDSVPQVAVAVILETREDAGHPRDHAATREPDRAAQALIEQGVTHTRQVGRTRLSGDVATVFEEPAVEAVPVHDCPAKE